MVFLYSADRLGDELREFLRGMSQASVRGEADRDCAVLGDLRGFRLES